MLTVLRASRVHAWRTAALSNSIDGLSISKAREALAAAENDIDKALGWLSKDMVLAGAKKAAKSASRTTTEGLIGLSVLARGVRRDGIRAAMVELNCETDFVARNDLFTNLLDDIAHTAAFLAEHDERALDYITPVDIATLEGAPLISSRATGGVAQVSVGDSIRETIAKTGELIVLHRAVAVARHPFPPAQAELALHLTSYAHGGAKPMQGRTAALALIALKSSSLSTLLTTENFTSDLDRIERSLARQIVGYGATRLRAPEGEEDSTALYEQPFGMLAGTPTDLTVAKYLKKWAHEQQLIYEGAEDGGISILEMERWKVGDA
ncbi:EF-TsMt 1 [Vararia minispora EC-137]|uniref:EF-TsMt 1 n=1 Tax=Vararia minispora EC-137 TaxID=1314806 RepID=A0ACB8QQE9_9AGAM|nr:EF-TsMt 1 [Vararia minispora EC-137]